MARIREKVTDTMDPRLDPQLQARGLYWQGWGIKAIARHIGAKPTTVYSWKNRGNWDGGTPAQRVLASAEARVIQLVNLDKKSDGNYKEITQLSKLIDGFSGGNKAKEPILLGSAMPDSRPVSTSTIDNPPVDHREQQERSVVINPKPEKNYFTPAAIKKLKECFFDTMYEHQKKWWESREHRLRFLLKSRQIGATFHFSREACYLAVTEGFNKIFISASRAQAYQFKSFIINMAKQADVELTGGDTIIFGHNAAECHFLGTNSTTAQGRTGDVYIDEAFWIANFKKLSNLAEPMASQHPLRTTYFSTPTTTSHEAYELWTGEHFNEGRPSNEHISLNVLHEALKDGRLDPDGFYRQIVTLMDAADSGYDRFDLDHLKRRYNPERFAQLFMGQFVTDGDSAFTLEQLKRHGVDTWDEWDEFWKPFSPRPLGHAPVWLGYDPSEGGDTQALVVLMAPQRPGDKFRLVEKVTLNDPSHEKQADIIEQYTKKYNVQKIVIDINGMGSAVYQYVQKFYPAVIGKRWDADEKAQMVFKMQSVMRSNRFEFDQGDKDIFFAFMSISWRQLKRSTSFASNRTQKASHGDVAWATIMTVAQEPFTEQFDTQGSIDV